MFQKSLQVGFLMMSLMTVVIIAGAENGRAQKQDLQDLSGTWELIEFDGTRKADDESRFPRVTLLVSQSAAEIRITKKMIRRGAEQLQEFAYYTDGRGEINTGRIQLWPRDAPSLASVTQWSKGKLLTRYRQQPSGFVLTPRRDSFNNVRQEWRLASDGKTLVMKTSTVQTESAWADGSSQELGPKATFMSVKLTFKKVS